MKNNIKDDIKKLIPGYIIAFVASFMIYIYEPILTYSSNINDFWFDFSLMLPNILLYSIIMFFGISAVYTVIYLVDKICFKKERIYKAILIISWIVFICTYIQGNYLTGSLPVLDGTTINWNNFLKENIISVGILAVTTIIEIVLLKKIKYEKTIKINTYLSLAVFAMILTSFISVLCTPELFEEKTISTVTDKNFNTVSSDKNFFIFLVDAVDSGEFAKVLQESPEYSSTFENFTYFPDTVSGYTFTRDSIPFILSGQWNRTETEFTKYYNDAFSNSKMFEKLKNKNYNMNLYEPEVYCNKKNSSMFDNLVVDVDEIDRVSFFKQLTKYLLFKYLPYQFKEYSKIETADFQICKINKTEESSYFDWTNIANHERFKNESIHIKDEKMFQFIHVEGGHVPFNNDEDLNIISEEEGTYQKKLKATLKLINEFIDRLKQNKVYDNSVIIVMADHGYWAKTGRQNPILYIKGINEQHEMITSEIPLSYEDLIGAYEQLLEDKKSTELFENIDKNRTRKFIDNSDNMKEYVVKGYAWDSSKISESEIEYNR